MPPSAAVPLLTIVTLALGAVAVSAREWPDLQQLAFRTPEIKSRGYHGSHIHSLSDFKFKIIAHRDGKDKACYLQSIAPGNLRQNLELYKNILYEKTNIKRAQNAFVTAPGSLSKSQVLHLAGNKIARFCRGFTTMILLPGPPNVIVNDFPESEENKEKEPKLPKYLKEQILMKRREKRSAKGKKKYQGQTQVQTISTGGDQPNLAEGVSQKNTSIAKVSTHRGMSQAQSQSAYEEDCDTCGDRHTPQRQPYPDAFAPGSYSPGGIPPSNVAHQPGFQQRGQTFGPGGQIYGPDGRPTQPAGSQGLRPGEYLGPDGQIYGPDGRPLGSRGNGQRPGGQGYGQNGQQVRPGGPILRPGEYFGPGGQIYGPDGRPITPGQGLRPGERGGQIFGPDGRPIYPGQGQRPDALGPGGQIYGPDGRPRTSEGQGSRPGGSDGQQLGPAGQVYGPGGRPVVPGGQYLRPGETLGPGGQIYGPDGRPDVSTGQRPGEGIAPGGQSYGPDGRPQVPGGQALRPGETYGTGGQLFSPDGRPLTSGGQGTGGQQFGPGGQIFQPGQILRPGETLGPGGQVYGPDGRPTINGGKRPGESFIPGGPGGKPFGETLGPGGQILFRPSGQPAFPGGQQPGGAFGPDGRPTSLGNLGAAGGEKIYGPDSRQITPQIPGGQRPGENIGTDGRPLSPGELQQQPGLSHSPSGQIYGPDGRPITQGGQKFHPNGQPFDPQGQRFQPGGQNWRPGETGGQIYGPDGRPIISGASGGQILGPDGRPLSIGNQGLQPVGSLGPDGRPYSNGQNLQPGYTVTNDPRNPLCFIYCKTTGPDGRPIAPGQGQRPGDGLGSYGTSYGPDGRPIYSGQKPFGSIGSAGPGGRPSESGELHPSRGIYGPSEQQIGTGQNAGSRGQNLRPGETLRPGGQIYGPDGRPVGSGGQNLRPGETLGPGGQIYGPDGRPIRTGGQTLRPGETLGPGGQIYGPDGRPVGTGGQNLRPGETLRPGGESYGPDGRPIAPGGQVYGADGRPLTTGVYNGGQRNGNFGNEDGQTLYPGNGRQQLTNGAGGTGNQFPYQPGTGGQQFGANGGRYGNGAPPQGIGSPYGPNYGQGQQNIYNPQLTGQQYNPNGNQYGLNGQGVSNYPGGGQPNGLYNQNGYNNLSPGLPGEVGQNVGPDGRPLIYGSSTGANLGTPGAQSGGTDGSLTHGSPLDLNRSIPGVDDDGHSQVDVSVVQENNETIASSLSQGRFGGGKTQTSVSGSYKGGGSFSAQAQTIDGKRGAQSQVVGGDDGASSSGQAFGGKGQSQSQISLSTDTGLTSASSQTTGNNYGTQSEVQAGETGGNSVAQASGIGKTSSQAQVKFKPYDSATDDDSQKIVFRGGGSASAQTGPRTGVSQSKIHGSFKHGISYSGVAQASSGSKDELERDGLKPLDVINLNATSDAPNKVPARRQNSPPPATSPSTTTTTNAPLVTSDDDDDDYDSAEQESLPGTTEVPRRTERGDQPSTHLENSDDLETSPSQSGVQPYPYVTRIDLPPGDLEHGYLRQRQESDGRRDHSAFSVNNFKQEQYQSRFQQQPYQRQTVTVGKPVGSVANPQGQSSGGNQPSQSQSVILGDLGNTGVRVMQDADGMGLSNGEVLQPGQSVPGRNGYSIPSGFRGRVVGSSAGNNGARASSDRGGQAQTQTVILTPEPGKFEYKGPNGLENKAADNADYDEYEASQESEEEERQPLQPRQRNYGAFQAPPTSFVSVTQKVSSQAPYSSPRELEHTYYTKASKCGYYTFSCQIVEGSNGRAKVCKPKFNMDDKNCN